MAIASLRKQLTTPATSWSDGRVVGWYGLGLLIAVYYGWLVLQDAFSSPYVVQDDARQHVFWMQRWLDPALLPNDFMADYFASRAPVGYAGLYRGAMAMGIDPFIFNKILPPLLSLLGTHFCFRFSMQLLPVPVTAFTSTLLLNQSLWMRDDLVSGTPRAFCSVLLLAFLVYANQRALLPGLIVLALQPLLYPQCAVLSAGILVVRLLHINQAGQLRVSRQAQDYWFAGLGLALLGCLLWPYTVDTSGFGPLVTAAMARTMPEFWPGGRAAYFTDNPLMFWFGDRSGWLPTPVLTPPLLAFSLGFPYWWWRRPNHPWIRQLRTHGQSLQHLVLVSFVLYFAAHLLLFKLHLPSRYTHHSLRIVFALTASFSLWIVLDTLLAKLSTRATSMRQRANQGGAIAASLLITVSLLGYSTMTQSFPFTNNRYGTVPELYEFLRAMPTDTVVASLTKETSNLHVFSQRSPLITPELGLPYHQGYYHIFRQRAKHLIAAQYSPTLDQVQAFIEQYDIDFWLLDDLSFEPAWLADNDWLQQYQPEAEHAIAAVSEQTPPALATLKSSCTVLETPVDVTLNTAIAQRYWLLDAQCILNRSPD